MLFMGLSRWNLLERHGLVNVVDVVASPGVSCFDNIDCVNHCDCNFVHLTCSVVVITIHIHIGIGHHDSRGITLIPHTNNQSRVYLVQ